MRIGIVDLDTSHPANWIPIIRELGHEIVGLWDGGEIHPKGYAMSFAEEHNVPRVYPSLAEMVPEVDCAIIHSCNWDRHLERAEPFAEAGRSILIDKPIAGSLRDLQQIRTWVEKGIRISGGSSLRFCREVNEWHSIPLEERGRADTVFCGCGVDEFNYGIHAYSLLSAAMGPGVTSVRHINQGVQDRIQVNWSDGRTGFLVVGTARTWLPFHATVVTDRTVTHFQPDSSNLYRALLEAVLPYLAGETTEPPLQFDVLIEPELCALAARRSRIDGNCEVYLSDLTEQDPGYNGEEFARTYRRSKYPS